MKKIMSPSLFQKNPFPDKFDNQHLYLGENGVSRWYVEPLVSRTSRTQQHNIIPAFHKSGPQGKARTASSAIESFQCMTDDEIIDKTVDSRPTNIYIEKIKK